MTQSVPTQDPIIDPCVPTPKRKVARTNAQTHTDQISRQETGCYIETKRKARKPATTKTRTYGRNTLAALGLYFVFHSFHLPLPGESCVPLSHFLEACLLRLLVACRFGQCVGRFVFQSLQLHTGQSIVGPALWSCSVNEKVAREKTGILTQILTEINHVGETHTYTQNEAGSALLQGGKKREKRKKTYQRLFFFISCTSQGTRGPVLLSLFVQDSTHTHTHTPCVPLPSCS